MKISKKYLIVGVLLVLLVGGAITTFSMNKNNNTTKTDGSSQNTTSASTKTDTKSQYANATLYKLDDTVRYQSVSLRVNSVKSSSSISSAYSSPVFADAGTKFIIVNLTVTNVTTNPFIYDTFSLIDQKDRLFNAYGDTIGNIDDYLDGAELSPSVPKTGNEVYQVPQDSITLRLGGKVGNTDKILLVRFQVE
jgi:hypothetical protein